MESSTDALGALFESDPEFASQIREALSDFGVPPSAERGVAPAVVDNARVWRFRPAARRASEELTWFQSWLVHPSRKRNVVAVAARRSGKTVGARLLCILAGLDPGPGDIGYMAPTLGQAKRLLWRPLMQDFRDPASQPFIIGKPNNSELTVEFVTGTRLYLFSAEAPERVRGEGFKLFITDETDDPLFTQDIFDEAIGPALSDNQGRLVQLGTPKGRGRLYREYQKGQISRDRRDDYDTLVVTAKDAGIIPIDEIRRAQRDRPARAYRQEYEASFEAPIGLVYDEWKADRHVVKPSALDRVSFDYKIAGVDWGTAARGTMLIAGVDREQIHRDRGERPRLWVVDEISKTQTPYTDDGWWQHARDLQRTWHPKYWYFDPAQGLDKYGEQLRKVVREIDPQTRVLPADNKVRPGISSVQEMLHYNDVCSPSEEPHLYVLDTCKNLIEEMPNYRYRAKRKGEDDDYVDEVVKENDHSCDALRYMTFTHFFSRTSGARHEEGAGW